MCLTEALNQWYRIYKKGTLYQLYYNSNHCICAESNQKMGNYLLFQDFGKSYFENSFDIKSEILNLYFEINK